MPFLYRYSTSAPTAPSTSDPATFQSRASALLSWWTSGTEIDIINGYNDTTDGRILTTGAGGWMGAAIDTSDCDTITTTGLYAADSSASNRPGGSGSWVILHVTRVVSPARYVQMAMSRATDATMASRFWDGSTWSDWNFQYSQDNIVGTVSETSGTPTGAIIENGSNANGSYVKYADGTMECRHLYTMPYSSAASLYGTWTFPASFADANARVLISPVWSSLGTTGPGRAGISTFATATVTANNAQMGMTRATGETDFDPADDCDFHVTAKGLWFT